MELATNISPMLIGTPQALVFSLDLTINWVGRNGFQSCILNMISGWG